MVRDQGFSLVFGVFVEDVSLNFGSKFRESGDQCIFKHCIINSSFAPGKVSSGG